MILLPLGLERKVSPFSDGFFGSDNDLLDEGPSTRVTKNDKQASLELDLPGVKPNEVSVVAENGIISIRATRHIRSLDGTSNKKARISKSITLDEKEYDIEKTEANLAYGVLTLTFPVKTNKPSAHIIKVKTNKHTEDNVEKLGKPVQNENATQSDKRREHQTEHATKTKS